MEWMFDVLKELAEIHRLQLVHRVRNELGSSFNQRYLRLFDRVYDEFYGDVVLGRWYDPYHMLYTTLFNIYLVKRREAPEITLAMSPGHDNGYRFLADKAEWMSAHSRILHQVEGAATMAELLVDSDEFSAKEIGRIVRCVGKHDNGYLGIPPDPKDPALLGLIDADRVWVMHPLSFYKDWVSKLQKGENSSLLEFFRSRLVSFYGPDKVYPAEWGKAESPDEEDIIQLPPFTKLAKEWRDKQFAARFQEIQSNIIQDPETFRKRLDGHISSESETGRG